MEEITKIADFSEYKKALTEELQKSAEGFIRIGYLLRMATETEILAGSGYANVYDFAQAEYGLDKSQVSRFMAINKKFSLGGYSDQIQPLFAGYGSSKLAVMLQLPDEIISELSPEFSKAEITAIKDEVKEELSPEAPSDLEVMAEPGLPEYDSMDLWQKAIYEYVQSHPDEYMNLYIAAHGKRPGAVFEVLAPAGEAMLFARVTGIGKVSISVKAGTVAVYAIRSGEAETKPWGEVEGFIRALTGDSEEDPPACVMWSFVYHSPFPIEEKAEEKKPSRVEPERKKEKAEQKPQKTEKKPQKTVSNSTKPQKPAMPKPEVLPPEQVEEIRPEIAPEQPEQMDIADILPREDLPGDYVHQKETVVAFSRIPGLWKEIEKWVGIISHAIGVEDKDEALVREYAKTIVTLCDEIEEEREEE